MCCYGRAFCGSCCHTGACMLLRKCVLWVLLSYWSMHATTDMLSAGLAVTLERTATTEVRSAGFAVILEHACCYGSAFIGFCCHTAGACMCCYGRAFCGSCCHTGACMLLRKCVLWVLLSYRSMHATTDMLSAGLAVTLRAYCYYRSAFSGFCFHTGACI